MEKQQPIVGDPRIVGDPKIVSDLKILLLRLSSLGDIVLTLPLIKALRLKYPGAQIDFVIRTEFADVLRSVTEITNLIELDVSLGRAGLDALQSTLVKTGYTHVLDLHNNFRTQALRKSPHANTHVINKRSLKRWLLVQFKINLLKDTPDVIGRYFETAEVLGVKDDGSAPRFSIHVKQDPKLIAIAPGSRHWNKRWPTGYFIEVVKKLVADGYHIEIYGSAEDNVIAQQIEQSVMSGNIVNLAGSFTIAETIERMSYASLAITNDSGLMHIANALGIRTISIFGPTVREFGFFPRNNDASIIENEGLYCRPCTAIGREDCPEKHFRCMIEITPEKILEIALPV